MRDILIVSIVAVAAALAFRRPWIGVMLWTWLSIMNPHRYSWGFAYSAPLAAVAAGVTVLGLLTTKDRRQPFQGAPTIWFFLFAVWITLSWVMGVDPAGDFEQWKKIVKIYFMTFVALMLLQTRMQLMAFAWVTAGSLALLGAKGGLFTLLTGGGYRVWGPPGSFIADNNEFALSLIITIPILYFLRQQVPVARRWVRLAVLASMILCAVAAIGSHSRGALIAIAAMSAMLWLRSSNKLSLGLLLVLAVTVALPLMPESWWTRMETIETYEDDKSAIGRLNAWAVAWEVAKTHLTGAGMSYQHQAFFSLYGPYESTVRAAHSIYFQVLGNHGFIGLLLFLGIWISTYRTAGWLRRNAVQAIEAKWAAQLGSMVQVSLVGYAVGGAFLSLSYFDLPYNLMVLIALTRVWVENRSWEREPNMTIRELFGMKPRTEIRANSGKVG